MRKYVPISLVSVLVLLQIFGFRVALLDYLSKGGMFIYSGAYLVVWLLIIFISVIDKYKEMLNLYIFYWSVASILFTLCIVNPLFALLGLVFIFPMIGFVSLFVDNLNSVNSLLISFIFLLIISLTMLFLGIFAKRKYRL